MAEPAAKRANWTSVAFGDVVRLYKERSCDPEADGFERYVGLEHLDPGDPKIRSWGSVADGTTFTNVFRAGQVLFGKRRAYQRKVAVADFSGVCSGDIYVFESKDPTVLLPSLLQFVCQTDAFFDHAVGTSAGSLSPRTNWKSLATYEFALPPLEEQRRIVEACSSAWRCVEAASDARRAGESARKSLICFLYQGGASTEPRRKSPMGSLPGSWQVAPLGDRYEVQLGKMMSSAAREGPNQVPYIRNANVQWNALDLEDVATMNFSDAERKKFELRSGDILACEGRHVGKSALWRDETPGACYQKALHRIRRLGELDVSEYLLHCLQYYSWAGRFVAATGETTIPHLPAERLRAMLFPFPPREQQEAIAGTIRAMDESLDGLSRRVLRAREVLSCLLQTEGWS